MLSNPSSNHKSTSISLWVIGALTIATAVGWIQFSIPSVCCGDFDGYYHIKWSRLLWESLRHGHLPAFAWLPLTTLSPARYADQHFLYHLLLIPFTWLSDLRLGAKLGAALFAGLAVFALYWLVLRYRVRYPLIWLLALLACSWQFYVRLSLTRASSLSIVFIVAGIFLLFERKYIWLALAAFLYVWAYNLFVMLIVLAALWTVIVLFVDHRIEWRPVFWSCAGTIAGFVVHPYFPRNAKLFFEHLASKSGAANAQAVVGMEWYPLPTWTFVNGALVACLAMVAGYIAFGYLLSFGSDRTRLFRPLLFMTFSSFLLIISLRFTRFIEYWPPFAVLFLAFTLNEIWIGKAEPESQQGIGLPATTGSSASRTRCLGLASVLLLAGIFFNFYTARANMRAVTKDADHYQEATRWMIANIPAGALIYDVNWSDFGKLFFYDTTHRYVAGLDPIYLLDVHPEIEQLTRRLSEHAEPDPAGAMAAAFEKVEPAGVNYIFVGDYPAAPPPEWFNYMMRTGKFAVVYRDPESVILQVLDVAPAEQSDNVRNMDSPEQRKSLLPQVARRFGKDVFATDEESMPGGPALVIHYKQATGEWARRLFQNDANSISGELLWQLGYRLYIVTDGKNNWAMEVRGNPKFRGAFANQAPAKQ